MSALTANVGTAITELEVPGMNLSLYILLPLIMVVAIASVVGIRWLYKKTSK